MAIYKEQLGNGAVLYCETFEELFSNRIDVENWVVKDGVLYGYPKTYKSQSRADYMEARKQSLFNFVTFGQIFKLNKRAI